MKKEKRKSFRYKAFAVYYLWIMWCFWVMSRFFLSPRQYWNLRHDRLLLRPSRLHHLHTEPSPSLFFLFCHFIMAHFQRFRQCLSTYVPVHILEFVSFFKKIKSSWQTLDTHSHTQTHTKHDIVLEKLAYMKKTTIFVERKLCLSFVWILSMW